MKYTYKKQKNKLMSSSLLRQFDMTLPTIKTLSVVRVMKSCYNFISLVLLHSISFFFRNVSYWLSYTSFSFFFKIVKFLKKKITKKVGFFRHKFMFFLYTVLTFFFKKPVFLLGFIKTQFWVKSPDNIKKVLYFIRSFFKRFNFFFLTFFYIHGFFFSLKGKIGVYGNSRKKIQRLKYGNVSSTNYVYNWASHSVFIINKSGLTNFKFYLFF